MVSDKERFEIRTGKFGQYFYDNTFQKEMGLQEMIEAYNHETKRFWPYEAVVKNNDYLKAENDRLKLERAEMKAAIKELREGLSKLELHATAWHKRQVFEGGNHRVLKLARQTLKNTKKWSG